MPDAHTTSDLRDLLLLGNSRNEGQPFLAHAKEDVSQLYDGVATVLLVPYACPPGSGAIRNAQAFLADLDIDSVVANDDATAIQQISQADGVFIQGGNTFRLLRHLYDNGLVDALSAAGKSGIPMLGTSAGSNVMCPTISTTNDMPISEVTTLSALGLVPFQINAHFVPSEFYIDDYTGENRQERIEEFVEETGRSVLALPEGAGVRVRGDMYFVTGVKSCLIFSSNEQTTIVTPGQIPYESLRLLSD